MRDPFCHVRSCYHRLGKVRRTHNQEIVFDVRHFLASADLSLNETMTYYGLSLSSQPSKLRLQKQHLTKSSLSGVGQ